LFQISAILFDLGLRLTDFRVPDNQLRLRDVLFVQCHLIIFLSVIKGGGGNHAVFRHVLSALIGPLE